MYQIDFLRLQSYNFFPKYANLFAEIGRKRYKNNEHEKSDRIFIAFCNALIIRCVGGV